MVFRVAGPEERVVGAAGVAAEVVEAACRLAGMVVRVEGVEELWENQNPLLRDLPHSENRRWALRKSRRCWKKQWRGGRKINRVVASWELHYRGSRG